MNAASNIVWALVCGLPGPERSRVPIVPLKAYIDESGDGQPPVLVLAGWIATAVEWARFTDEWDRLRHTYRFKVLHMAEAMTLQGEFYGWSDVRRDECVVQAQRIINDHVKFGICHVLPIEAYRRIIQSDENAPTHLKNPYSYAFFQLIRNFINDCSNLGISERVDFVFDERVQEKAAIYQAWDGFVANGLNNKQCLGSTPIFDSDERTLPLQAADLAAWCARVSWNASSKGKDGTRLPWSDKNIGIRKLRAYVWDEVHFLEQRNAKLERRAREYSEFSLGILSFGC